MLDKYGKIYGGYMFGVRKFLVVNDPDMIRDILVKHFQVFPHRVDWNISPLPRMNRILFFVLGNDSWKRSRSKMTPAFTSGKLKAMMSHLSDISDNLVKNLEKLEKKGIFIC